MKKFVFAVLLATTSLYCHAIDGHNGIKFSMTQKQLEGMGFICNPETRPEIIATCKHMDMTGTAFSVPARNYKVEIGKDKRVAIIDADLVGNRSAPDYRALISNISEFFPKKDEARTYNFPGNKTVAWRANNNAGIMVNYGSGVVGLINSSLRVTFLSPSFIAATDKKRAEEAAESSRAERNASRENSEGQERSPKQK